MTSLGKFGLACLIVFSGASPVFANDSAYTPFSYDTENCKSLLKEPAPDEPDVGAALFSCPGYKAYPVIFKEGDGRASLQFGPVRQALIDNAWESFAPFNSVKGKIEWRLDGTGKPIAAIYRYRIENLNPDTMEPDDKHVGNVLVVARVAQTDDPVGCVIGLVDAQANKNANELAREIADTITTQFRCMTDQPAYAGARGANAADFDASFGQ